MKATTASLNAFGFWRGMPAAAWPFCGAIGGRRSQRAGRERYSLMCVPSHCGLNALALQPQK